MILFTGKGNAKNDGFIFTVTEFICCCFCRTGSTVTSMLQRLLICKMLSADFHMSASSTQNAFDAGSDTIFCIFYA